MSAVKWYLADRTRRPGLPNTKAVPKKLASPISSIAAPLGFLGLPSEIRNQIYTCLFPRNTRFETSQTTCTRDHKNLGRGNRAEAHLHHKFSTSPAKRHITYFVGILGTCRKIREEATGIFIHNLAGTFVLDGDLPELLCIPPVILKLIDTVTLSPTRFYIRNWTPDRLLPNVKKFFVGSFVLTMHTIPEDLRDLQAVLDRATFKERVKTHFNSLGPRNPMGNERLSSRAFHFARSKTPSNWMLLSRACPVAVILHIYVVDPETHPKHKSRGGFLLEFNYNHGRVVSIEEKQFDRLPMSCEPDSDLRRWWNPDLWRYVDVRADENFVLGD